jgi:hypothetical protein
VGASKKDGASRWFFVLEAALVKEVAKRKLAMKRRLAAERWLVAIYYFGPCPRQPNIFGNSVATPEM